MKPSQSNCGKYGLNRLRELFLSFFEEKEHLRLPGFSLIPKNDASLLLIGSGMAPMKTWFTGEQEPPRKRVCTCQKCIRTVDIDSVGKTARHGSYFEMLGNFSFGDYFKHDAIVWCWEFLTDRLGLDSNLLYPSVYTEDDEALRIWTDVVGINPARIVKLGREDNFWDHGSGPCGPCSEVYFDRGANRGCGKPDCAPGCDCDRYVEVWNNVFTQYNNDGNGNYTELAQKNIDTGLGLERLACVCQDVDNIFEVDTIRSIINKVSAISGRAYGKDADADVSIRIITDHIRAATMMICDGILPSNEGRGYVLRRLLRRAARHGRLLGIQEAFLRDVCSVVIAGNKDAYPDLHEKDDFIKRILSAEEESFNKTIDAGMTLLGGFITKLKDKNETILTGADAFKLYDTFGFPLDLTVDILAEHGMTADTDDFNKKMNEQRARARKAREAMGDLAWESFDLGLGSTPTLFTGYDKRSDTATVLAIVSQSNDKAQGELVPAAGDGSDGYIVLDKTPFYAEKGGQSADIGTISVCNSKCGGDVIFDVTNVQQDKSEKYLHHGKMRSGVLSVGDTVEAQIEIPRRDAISRAHSATHLLHEALRTVLGSHVNQAGSLVEPDKIRFDFTHFAALSSEEITEIEMLVNEAVLSNHSVYIEEMPADEAKNKGATALFGEKYADIVRVVTMGNSVELCGGTHLDCTARVGSFAILSEFSVASGVRRIEAVTGKAALEHFRFARRHLSQIAETVRAGVPEEIAEKLAQTLSAMRELRAKLDAALIRESRTEALNMLTESREVKGLHVVTTLFKDTEADIERLRLIEDNIRDLDLSAVAVLAAVKNDKITIMAACGKTAVTRGIKAGDIIREIAKICGGSGGGKPEFAMGGGKDASKLPQALAYVDKYINDTLE